ncbi:MAG: hypothetical protein VX278_23350 [Myxococcota bacterium]|nr:hypothetical protein [Myxococcota bacterium]
MLLSLLFACNIETPILSDSVAPLEENTAPDPSGDVLSLVSGTTDEYGWVHAKAILPVDIGAAWGALRSELVYIDHEEVTEYTIEEVEDENYDYRYLVHNYVENIATVEFDVDWRHAANDFDNPQQVGARWQKVSGTEFITLLEGSILIEPHDDGTVINVIEHIDAALTPEERAVTYVTGLHERWLAYVRGEEMPTYD